MDGYTDSGRKKGSVGSRRREGGQKKGIGLILLGYDHGFPDFKVLWMEPSRTHRSRE